MELSQGKKLGGMVVLEEEVGVVIWGFSGVGLGLLVLEVLAGVWGEDLLVDGWFVCDGDTGVDGDWLGVENDELWVDSFVVVFVVPDGLWLFAWLVVVWETLLDGFDELAWFQLIDGNHWMDLLLVWFAYSFV